MISTAFLKGAVGSAKLGRLWTDVARDSEPSFVRQLGQILEHILLGDVVRNTDLTAIFAFMIEDEIGFIVRPVVPCPFERPERV